MKKTVFLITLILTFGFCAQSILASDDIDGKPEINEISIGYQAVKVSDVTISETAAGMLQKGKQVRISLSDHISQDMYFHPDFEIEITGDLKIKNQGTNYSLAGSSDGEHYILLEVERASTVPSTIKLSNMYVKVDRTVPVSAQPYELIIWGNAVVANLGPNQEQFRNAGIKIPYCMVTDPATKAPYLDVYKGND